MSKDQNLIVRQRIRTPAPIAPKSCRKRQSFKKADVLRAMDAVKAAGLDVGFVELAPDGTIRLAAKGLTTAPSPGDVFASWEARL